ncbi:P2 family phage major capsid protein [Halopseudomonas pachastrellae]|nr:P2 family phage major capsid protein [Halopseudomonas pachastrellae]
MRNTTRLIFNGYLSHVAQLNGVAEAVHKFNVEPTVQQKLETAIQESNSMLQMINVIGVDDQSGEALLLDVNGPLASRTQHGCGQPSPAERPPRSDQRHLRLQAD